MTFSTTTDPKPAKARKAVLPSRGRTRHELSERTRQLRDEAQRAARQARIAARRYAAETRRQAERGYDNAPLVFGALSFAIGAGIAALLPRTRPERNYLGPYSQRIRDEVETIYREERDRMTRAARQAAEEARAALRDG